LFFRAIASCLKILNGEKIFNTVYSELAVIRVIWASVVCKLDQSQTLRSGTVAFNLCDCTIEVAYIFASVKAIIIKFLFWENTTRAGFKPILPISSNRAPRRRGPRAPSVYQIKLVLSIEAACV